MEKEWPSIGEAIQVAAGRTSPLTGWGWRCSLWGAFEPFALIVEAEWAPEDGVLSIVTVPARAVSDVLLQREGAGPVPQDAVVVVETLSEAALRQAELAWELAATTTEPAEPWNGRDGCWARTEAWRSERLVAIVGDRFPAGEIAAIDALHCAIFACCSHFDLPDATRESLARWRRWCAPPRPRSRNQMKHRR